MGYNVLPVTAYKNITPRGTHMSEQHLFGALSILWLCDGFDIKQKSP